MSSPTLEVNTAGFTDDSHALTFNYGDADDITSQTLADALTDLACSLDTSTANTVVLAADGDPIFGKIFSANYYKQGSTTTVVVMSSFSDTFEYDTDSTVPVLGGQIVGAGSGLVRAADDITVDPTATSDITLDNPAATVPHRVLKVDTTNHLVTVRFGF